MATKSKAATVKPATGGALVDYSKVLADLAAKQSKSAASLASGSTFASFRGAQLVINGAALPGAKANVIVLGVMQERAYYEGDFDPDNKTAPVCYAYGEINGGPPTEPHEKASNKQHSDCKSCPHAQFGSAERGRGQACRQSQRISFVAADGKTEGESAIIQAKIPPTSLKNVKGWLDEIGSRGLATPQVVTELSVTPDPKNQIAVHLKMVSEVRGNTLAAIMPRLAIAEKTMTEPYPEMEETKPAKAGKTAARRKKY